MMSHTRRTLIRIFNGTLRKNSRLTVNWDMKTKDATLSIYLGFMAADRCAQSDSQYLG